MAENKPVLKRHHEAAEQIEDFASRLEGFSLDEDVMAQIIANAEPPSLNDAELLDRIQACTEENTELHKRIERLEALIKGKKWRHTCKDSYYLTADGTADCHHCQVEAILHPKESGR